MNKRPSADLQLPAAVGLCYRLLDVQVLKDDPLLPLSERAFIVTKSHLLLLSQASGSRIVVDGRVHALRPGWLFVCAPGQLIEWTNQAGQPLELLLMYFHTFALPGETAVARTLEQPMFPVLGEAALPSASTAGQWFGALNESWQQGSASGRLRCEAGLLELLSLTLAHQERQTELALEAARAELERHYAGEIAIESLARTAGLSRFHFMRLFKERFGRGVAEYRTELRIREAKRLMSGGDLTLGQIVEQVGYANESYFSTLFKKQTGFAPATYQRNRRMKIAAYSWINLGQLLALQTIPFAAPMDQYWTDRYRTKYGFEVTTPLSHHYEFNLNALREARPSGIVAIDEFVPAEEQDKLREIAPALFLSWKDDWRSHLGQLGGFLDRGEEAEAWLKRYERQAKIVKEQMHAAFGDPTVLVLAVSRDRLSVWGRQAGGVLYDDLGFRIPAALRDIGWNQSIEAFELAQYGADRILVHVDGNVAAESRWLQLSRGETWRKLPAVRSGQSHLIRAYGCFDGPWNEYAAEPIGRFLHDVPSLFGLGATTRLMR